MKTLQGSASPLYRSLRLLRYILPIAAFLSVVAHQAVTYVRFPSLPFSHFLWQVLLYGTVGPVLAWLMLTWLMARVRERDEAEAHLRCLYDVSRKAVTTTEMKAVVEIALRMPEQILSPVATGLILREHAEGPWTLAGVFGMQAEEEAALKAHVSAAGEDLRCSRCAALAATVQQNCPLRSHLPYADLGPTAPSVICLSLSTEQPPLALLNVYLLQDNKLSAAARQTLESGAAVLAVALDHARLRGREVQMLQHMEQTVDQQADLAAALTRILGDIARAHRAQAGQVFLVSPEGVSPTLTSIASWPGTEPDANFAPVAYQAFESRECVVTSNGSPEEAHEVALPLMAEGQTTGILVLVSGTPFDSSQLAFLRAAAGIVALIIRNSQLYTELESQAVLEERNRLAREVHDGLAQSLGFFNFKLQQIDRLLSRQQWEEARQALSEMRASVQDLYTEVRLTIQDLRWPAGENVNLVEGLEQAVKDFTASTGLDISLTIEGQPNLSPQEEVHLLRITQEALANVRKHAHARRAWVRLLSEADGITLEVEDDGIGLPAEATVGSNSEGTRDPSQTPGHFGLRFIQERVEAIDGRLSLHNLPAGGTRLEVKVTSSSRPAKSTPSMSVKRSSGKQSSSST